MAAEFSVVVRADNANDLAWFRPYFLMEINAIEMTEYESANISITVSEIQEMLSFKEDV